MIAPPDFKNPDSTDSLRDWTKTKLKTNIDKSLADSFLGEAQ